MIFMFKGLKLLYKAFEHKLPCSVKENLSGKKRKYNEGEEKTYPSQAYLLSLYYKW